jgi:CheY-like chemotaxis protein
MGLGLSIVRRVADLLECDLRLRSEIGRGSCFEISLPLASAAATPLGAPDHEACETSSTRLVVIVDDDKAIRAGMSALLADWGYEVLAAGSAHEAIRLLAGYPAKPDLLICDLRLRDGENGIAAIERLRLEYNERIPAMLITCDTAARRLHEAQTSELTVLHKPVPNGRLRATIARLVARP